MNPKRAILEVQLPINHSSYLNLMNTHLSAFSQSDNTMEIQVNQVIDLMAKKQVEEVLSDNFSKDWKTLPIHEKRFFLEKTVGNIAIDLKRRIRDNFFLPQNINMPTNCCYYFFYLFYQMIMKMPLMCLKPIFSIITINF